MLKDYNQVKATREYIIQYFAFCYNSIYIVYKDTKYSTGWWLEEPILNQAKAMQELEDEQDRIYYKIDIHGNTIIQELVIHLVKDDEEVSSDEEIFL